MFQAELVSVLKGLELCGSRYESFSVLSDSMSSLMALSDLDCEYPLLAKIHKSRVCLYVWWYSVKAHVSFLGNEAADLFARAVAELDVVSSHVDFPPSSVHHFLGQEIVRTWQERREDEIQNINVFHLLPKVSGKLAWTSGGYRTRIFASLL